MSKTKLPSFLREDAARTERWAHLTEGLAPYQTKVMEQLLDNVEEVIEAHKEDTNTSHVTPFSRHAKAMIRRVYPALVSNSIVSIQPTPLPDYKVFFLDFYFDATRAPTVKGDRMDYHPGKQNPNYARGYIVGEAVGTGNASTTVFTLKEAPMVSASLIVKVNSVVVSNYTLDATTGTITFAAAPGAGLSIVADYQVVTEGMGSTGTAKRPGVRLGVTSASVSVESLTLTSEWTIEVQQDLKAYHGENAESLLTARMSEEIAFEWDRLIINDLFAGATAGNVNWSKTVPGGWTQRDWYETLFHAIEEASLNIYKKRLVHATFVVMSPDNAFLLSKVNAFRVLNANTEGQPSIVTGPNVYGTLAGKYTVIVDPLLGAKMLVGHKGSDWMSTGYVFSPYTLFETETFTDPNTMKPRKGLLSRAARFLVSGDFYGTVTVTA